MKNIDFVEGVDYSHFIRTKNASKMNKSTQGFNTDNWFKRN